MAVPNPQLAIDWIEQSVRFPVVAQPKPDGCRGGQYAPGKFTGRSLKAYKNRKLTKFWSNPAFNGLDGELVLPPPIEWNYHAMCRKTTSVCNTIESPTILNLIAFDLVTPTTMHRGYLKRYDMLARLVERLRNEETRRLHLMPMEILRNFDELEAYEQRIVDEEKYEGIILRAPDAPFKPDRSGLGMELWRWKRRIDFEVRVTGLVEAMRNNNEAKTNALGRTERSTHKANKVGKGMVGMIKGEVLKDVVWQGKVLFEEGLPIDINPGEMTHAERKMYWDYPKRIVNKIGKVSVLPHGTKDKPRQPIWLTLRAKEDMV